VLGCNASQLALDTSGFGANMLAADGTLQHTGEGGKVAGVQGIKWVGD